MNDKGNDLSWYFKMQLGLIGLKLIGLLPIAWVWAMAPMWLFPAVVLGLLILAIGLAEIGIIPRRWI